MSDPRTWQYGLTADEWFHIASEGDASEVQPCCGDIAAVRDLVRNLMIFQAPEEFGWRKSIGRRLLKVQETCEGHGLEDRVTFPLYNRLLDAVRQDVGTVTSPEP